MYNAGNSIKTVLDKLTLQKIPQLEVLVYDDGSVDGSGAMVSELAGRGYYQRPEKNHDALRLFYFPSQHTDAPLPENALKVRRYLGDIAQQEYIFFLDSDVILPPNALPELLAGLKASNAMFMGIMYEPTSSHQHVMFGATLWNGCGEI